ncbi:protein kinase domain-containing protein [Micromonospora sp. NBC_01638]|uniref:serine/threonine-protein kinase n=1 Tax=Micromonospora sp. NBC_01638 TaxID=2975982 RepID=UPI003864E4F9|nr:protein kinase [Micromonospora sp. NBC_01638]
MQRDQLLAGRYRVLERLGSGGMSAVHRAYDEVLERDVAVKVLVTSDANARQRIGGEAKAAARLSHPHVTSVYDFGESLVDGAQVPFVVMELLGGHSLEQRLVAGPLSPRAGLRVCAEVAAALTAAHAQGLVHRDIKPGNVMLTPTGAKVLDFGIAAAIGAPEIDFEGRLLGTPAYLAPERLEAGEVLPACDVYALGLLLHRVLTGRLPKRAEAPTGTLGAHSQVLPDPLPQIDGVPPEVRRLYRWCLARDPADRPPAAEAARILLAAASTTAVASGTLVRPAAGTAEQTDAVTADPMGSMSGVVTPGRGSWRRRRAMLAVSGAVIAAMAMAGPLGDSSNRRPAHGASSTGIGPGTTTVGMPHTEEPLTAADARPSAVPSARNTAPDSRTGSGGTATPGPSATMPGPTPTRAAQTPTPTSGVPVDARGGTVTVRCVDKLAEVLAVTLAPGYRAEAYDPGPAKQVQVDLTSTEYRSEIRVHCPNGSPKPKVKERAV